MRVRWVSPPAQSILRTEDAASAHPAGDIAPSSAPLPMRRSASFPIHNVKQRRLLRSRGAFVRPGGVLVIASTPIEGRAERRQAHLFCCRAGEARPHPHPAGCGASHDAGRSPLGAPPWRFSAGGRASISGIASGSVQRAPRSQVLMPGGRCPGPPESAVTSRSRRTPLPAPPSGSPLEDGPS
jgi:hypothetical protein